MNTRNTSSMYPSRSFGAPVQRAPPARKTYTLFTWTRCKQCQDLKRNLVGPIQSGKITEYDLDNIRGNANLMNLFSQISPNRNVPAMAIFNNGQFERGVVGVGQIMGLF